MLCFVREKRAENDDATRLESRGAAVYGSSFGSDDTTSGGECDPWRHTVHGELAKSLINGMHSNNHPKSIEFALNG